MKLTYLTKGLYVLPVVFLLSCGGSNKTEEKQEISTEDTLTTEQIEEGKTFDYILPSPLQIASIFHKAKLKFNDQLLNPVSASSKYNTETKRLLNIGIYGADFSYALINNQNQVSLNYLKTIKELADKSGLGNAYNTEDLMNRFQKNLNNIDSLSEIVSTIQTETEAVLEENDKHFNALAIFSGGWVESMYLASKSIESNYNERIAQEIAEQHISLANLIKLLKKHNEASQPEFADISTKLSEINGVFENCADYKVQMELIVKEESGEEMPFAFKISQDELKTLSAKIQELRKLIIN